MTADPIAVANMARPSHNDAASLIPIDIELAGKSFLDINCENIGSCVNALQRGANKAVALLPDAERFRASRQTLAKMPSRPEIFEAEFENWKSAEQFDVIYCSTLQQMFDPIHSLRRMVKLARDVIILEIRSPDPRNLKSQIRGFLGKLLRREAAILLDAAKTAVDITDQAFQFEPDAIRILFNRHYACFEPVLITTFATRYVAVAKARKINSLTIVAGPTASGKTTFVQRLCDEAPLRKELGLRDISHSISGNNIHRLPAGEIDHLVLHYDLLRPFGRPLRNYRRDPALTILSRANEINILTIMTPSDRLLGQFQKSELSSPRPNSRHIELFNRYRDPSFLEDWYEKWFEFCAAKNLSSNRIVENTGTYRFYPAVSRHSGI